MYLKKNKRTEILQIKSDHSKSSAPTHLNDASQNYRSPTIIDKSKQPEIYKPDSKSNPKKVKIGVFDEEAISSAMAKEKKEKKPVIQGEKIELEARPSNPISEVIKELTIDLRHEKLISNADWSESSSLDLEHFNYSDDYSAFLSSYE